MGFRCRSADLWKLGARSLPEPQPLSARAPAGSLLFEPTFLSFPHHPLRPHDARTRACSRTPTRPLRLLNGGLARGRAWGSGSVRSLAFVGQAVTNRIANAT